MIYVAIYPVYNVFQRLNTCFVTGRTPNYIVTNVSLFLVTQSNLKSRRYPIKFTALHSCRIIRPLSYERPYTLHVKRKKKQRKRNIRERILNYVRKKIVKDYKNKRTKRKHFTGRPFHTIMYMLSKIETYYFKVSG